MGLSLLSLTRAAHQANHRKRGRAAHDTDLRRPMFGPARPELHHRRPATNTFAIRVAPGETCVVFQPSQPRTIIWARAPPPPVTQIQEGEGQRLAATGAARPSGAATDSRGRRRGSGSREGWLQTILRRDTVPTVHPTLGSTLRH